MTVEEAIQQHGPPKVFEAGTDGECRDYGPLQSLRLDAYDIGEEITSEAYRGMTLEEQDAPEQDA